MQIGLIQTEIRQFAQARDAYQRLLTIDPNFGPALNNLANIYSEQLSQLDKAYQLAARARKVPPDDPHVADTLGWIYFKKGMYHRPLALLEQSTAKLPAEPELQFHLGLALSIVGRRDEAMPALQRAIRASKDFPDKGQARGQIEQFATELMRPEWRHRCAGILV
jgi:tetratricopeptide (TPR) repeat protein